MPVLNPAELWRETQRYDVDNLFRLEDSSGKQYVLAMTHEECFTFHAAREIRSYRELPQVWYQIQTKERDEPRPKSGILRTREFMMKDSYSFDRDDDGLDASYDRHIEVYRRIFERCGLATWMVESDTGMMGGKSAHEFMAPSPSGEDRLVLCSNCDYAANLEVARSIPRPPVFPDALDAPQQVETPDVTTIEGLAEFLGVDEAATAKAMPVVAEGQVVLGLVRGDDRLHQLKMQKALKSDFRPATAEEIRSTFGAEPGSIGPVGVDVRVIADESLARRSVRFRRERDRAPSAGRPGRTGFSGRVSRSARGIRCRDVPKLRHRYVAGGAGHRGGQHLQAGYPVLRSSWGPPIWTSPVPSIRS